MPSKKDFSKTADIAARYKAIEQRAEKSALARGMNEAQAKQSAAVKTDLVKERLAIAKERQAVMQAPNKEAVAKVVAQQQAHRDKRIAQLKSDAGAANRPYSGPQQMPDNFKKVDATIKEREMLQKARLEENIKKGTRRVTRC